MIISASRRNDIPAFFSEWFFNRIKEGFVFVRNPMNPRQISKIPLTANMVDCFVFWTKNPQPMIPYLKILDDIGYAYYFQFTLNPYNQKIEPNVPTKKKLIETFIVLSEKIGKNRTIWRYDPIFLNEEITIDYHKKYFEYLISKLYKHTTKCVISFIDFYRKCERNLKPVSPILLNEELKYEIASSLKRIADKYNIIIETCAEDIDFSSIGINHGKCIDNNLIQKLCNGQLTIDKDKTQREACGCVKSIDIGAYNTCAHGCLYCYANFNIAIVAENLKNHDPRSPLLFGEVGPSDKINERKLKSIVEKQMFLL